MRLFFIFLLAILFLYSCNSDSSSIPNPEPEKNYQIDTNGQIISTEFNHHDFNSAHDCMECHQQHFDEWDKSMHAYSLKDEVFLSFFNKEREKRPSTGGNYCIQCHAPVAYLSDYSLEDIHTPDDLESLPPSIFEGITCTFCHTMSGTSNTVFTQDNVAASIDDYHLNSGENIFYGSIENPEENSFHASASLPFYSQSESCLPCHDQLIRNKEIETTFTEWQRVPGFGMSGSFPCQECHMPIKEDGHHDHTFSGVDVNLDDPQNLYEENLALLETSVIMNFDFDSDTLSLNNGDTLFVPIIIESLTGHRFPSGTSFTREAWTQISILNNNDIIFESGKIIGSGDFLNLNDPNLLLFTTWLLDENGDTTFAAGDAHDFINNSLQALSQRYHDYEFILNQDYESLDIEINMLFRALKPNAFDDTNMHLINSLPIYEIHSISKTIFNSEAL